MKVKEDDKTWQDLWVTIAPGLLAYLSSFGSLSKEDKQDIVQLVFLKAWQKRDTLDTNKGMTAWFYAVTRNSTLDFLKGRKRKEKQFPPFKLLKEEAEIEITGTEATPEESVLEKEQAIFIKQFLLGLKEKERELSHLYYAEGLSYTEIAEITRTPVGTIKWRASKIRKRLDKAYRKEFETC